MLTNKELFETLLSIYQVELETVMKGTSFIFDLLYCKGHKINSNCSRSHAGYPNWIKNKKQ